MTVDAWKHDAAKQLKANAVGTSWYLDARLLLEAATSLDQIQQILHAQKELATGELKTLEKLLVQRLEHKPMAYILGYKEFFQRTFIVNEHTLIPRGDTETLVECVLEYAKDRNVSETSPLIDVCCGSGAIGITLALELSIPLTLSDISLQALEVAKTNAETLLEDACILLHGDLLSSTGQKYGIIVSNPPYLTSQWCLEVSKEVSWEPVLALEGLGEDGLTLIRRLVEQSTTHLKDGGALFLECDYRQVHEVANLLEAHNF
ncbi:MAG: peptide chain release factor N(5)-glutamine methyltransferase, partial [Spirochaetia bacterium]|nr:peptide chain release factor N(5)-glutamine methyltransferase [Spirochaetia bacterium]